MAVVPITALHPSVTPGISAKPCRSRKPGGNPDWVYVLFPHEWRQRIQRGADKTEGVLAAVSVHDTTAELLHDLSVKADRVQAVRRDLRGLFLPGGVRVEPLVEFGNPFDLSRFGAREGRNGRPRFRAHSPDRRFILQVGRPEEENLDTLRRLLRPSGHPYAGVVVGQWDETLYRLLGAAPRVDGRYMIVKAIPDEELASFHSWAHFLCAPPCREGSGLLIVEATSAGLPVLVTRAALDYLNDDRADLIPARLIRPPEKLLDTAESIEGPVVAKPAPEDHSVVRRNFTSIVLCPDGGELSGAVHHLLKVTSGDWELILVDCGKRPAVLEGAPRLAGSFAEAAGMARGDAIVVLRSSSLPGEGWLYRLRRALFARAGYGIAAPMEHQCVVRPEPEELSRISGALAEEAEFRRIPAREAVDSCVMVRREIAQAAVEEEASTCFEFAQNLWLASAAAGLKSVIAGDTVVAVQGPARRRRSLSALLNASSGESRKHIVIERALLKVRESTERGDFEAAVEALRVLLRRFPDERPLLRQMGWLLLRAGWAEQAVELLGDRTEAELDDPEWLKLEGYCAESLGDLERAEACAERVLAEQPLSSRAALLRGLVATARGDAAMAERSFRSTIVTYESGGRAHACLGSLLWARGDREEGLAELERAFILSPQEPDIAATYTDAASQLGAGTRARGLVEEASRHSPGVRMLLQLKASFLLSEGRPQECLAALLEMMARFGVDDDTLNAAIELRKNLDEETAGEAYSPPRLALCMIVKDEQANLARCLWSVLPVVDEAIVVDTGSSDRSLDIALAYGCRVIQHRWDRSFSSARNAGLAAARGAWILVLDADEVLSVQDHDRLRELIAGHGARRQAYRFLMRSYVARADASGWRRNDGSYDEEAGSGWIPSLRVRLFPRDARIRFEGPVHELVERTIERAQCRIQDASVVIHHYGKLDHHRTKRKRLLLRELGVEKLAWGEQDSPDAVRERAVQEEELGNFDDALVHWRRYLNLVPEDPRALLGAGTSAIGAGEIPQALEALEEARRRWPERPEPSVQLAIALMHSGRVQESLPLLWEAAREHPAYHHAAAALALALLASGRKEEGLALVRKLQDRGVSLGSFFTTHGRRFLESGPHRLAVAVLQPLADAGMITPEQGSILMRAHRAQGRGTI